MQRKKKVILEDVGVEVKIEQAHESMIGAVLVRKKVSHMALFLSTLELSCLASD